MDIVSEINDPFQEAEEYLGIKIPQNLKNIFIANGFNDQFTLSTIDENAFTDTESFSKNDLPDLILQDEFEKYFGIFKNNIKKFRILEGHKRKFIAISNFYKNKFDSKKQDESKKLISFKMSTNQSKYQLNQKSSESKRLKLDKNSSENTCLSIESTSSECFNFDLVNEKRSVCTTLKRWLNEYFKQNAQVLHLYKQIQNVSSEILDITINVNDLNEEYQNGELIAHITCVLCNNRIKIMKLSKTHNSPSRWIYSNYHRHIKTHEKYKIIKTNTSGKQINTLKDYFIPSISTSTSTSASTSVSTLTLLDDSSNNNYSTKENITADNSDFDFCSGISGENTSCKTLEITPTIASKFQKTKWQNKIFSRTERNRRALHNALILDPLEQPLITNFYPILNKIEKIIIENQSLKQMLSENISCSSKMNLIKQKDNVIFSINEKQTSSLLKLISNTAVKNLSNNSSNFSNNNRYSEVLKKFCLYLLFVGGRMMYVTLSTNMKNCLPSISALFRYFNSTRDNIVEGSFRFKELKQFLDDRNLPHYIWISEDATRITGRIMYDSTSNKLVGFVQSLIDGCPNLDSFYAISAKEILEFFDTGIKANYAYVVMAQPIIDTNHSFCVSIFGTDNRFKCDDVLKRWKKINQLARAEGLHIMGFSSDGDTRLLKAMEISCNNKFNSNQIGNTHEKSWPWFHMRHLYNCNVLNDENQLCIQDSVHIATKLRTRFLNSNIVLKIGKYIATVDHLNILISKKTKDQHKLTISDLKGEDKMNYHAAEKIMSPHIYDLLTDIPDSLGTKTFLRIMNYATTPLIDPNLRIEDRIYRLWYCVFFLRIWRTWLLKKKECSLKNNYITSNCLSCIEINAHSLIHLVNLFHKNQNLKAEMFVPWLLNSQPCEKLFRAARSFTSTFSTVVNFSMYDLIHRLHRIEMLNIIKNDLSNLKNTDLSNTYEDLSIEFDFPITHRTVKDKNKVLITNEEELQSTTDIRIQEVIEKSLLDVQLLVTTLGLMEENVLVECSISKTVRSWITVQSKKVNHKTQNDDNSESNSDDDILQNDIININKTTNLNTKKSNDDLEMFDLETYDDEIDKSNTSSQIDLTSYLGFQGFDSKEKITDLNLKDYSKELGEVDLASNSPFVRLYLSSSKSILIKKSSLCWLLENNKERISTDRLRRFIVGAQYSGKCGKHKKDKNKEETTVEENSDNDVNDVHDSSDNDFNNISLDLSIDEVTYNTPVWSQIKPGVFLLVDFIGGNRKKQHFKYVCLVKNVDEEDGDILVQGLRKSNALRNEFYIVENDLSNITLEMILAILPIPTLNNKNRKLMYTFPGAVNVNEQ